MTTPAALGLVAAAAVVAFALRSSMALILADATIPDWLERGLSFIGPAVLASMTVNFAFGGTGGPHVAVPEFATMAVALGVSLWKHNVLVTLACSMPVLWLLTALT